MTALLVIIYLAFISLGLPDSLLGAVWPSLYPAFGVPVSWQGVLSVTISGGTILSSLCSEHLIRRFGAGRVTFVSVLLTAAALFGFSASGRFFLLWLCCVPLGLGAGSVDAALNNYVALHYKPRHMSWLHCFWGVGATLGPMILSACLTRGGNWQAGYRVISVLQFALTVVLLVSLPLWRKLGDGRAQPQENAASEAPLSVRGRLAIPGVPYAAVGFLFYCGLESCAGLWGASYLVFQKGTGATAAAGLASVFYVGITAGRLLSGFLTLRFTPRRLIVLGQWGLLAGVLLLFLGQSTALAALALGLIGLGCAPIYPNLIQSTPQYFGKEHSQGIIGLQMATAYVGSTFLPPLFGLLAARGGAAFLPVLLGALLAAMTFCTARLERIAGGCKNKQEG